MCIRSYDETLGANRLFKILQVAQEPLEGISFNFALLLLVNAVFPLWR